MAITTLAPMERATSAGNNTPGSGVRERPPSGRHPTYVPKLLHVLNPSPSIHPSVVPSIHPSSAHPVPPGLQLKNVSRGEARETIKWTSVLVVMGFRPIFLERFRGQELSSLFGRCKMCPISLEKTAAIPPWPAMPHAFTALLQRLKYKTQSHLSNKNTTTRQIWLFWPSLVHNGGTALLKSTMHFN